MNPLDSAEIEIIALALDRNARGLRQLAKREGGELAASLLVDAENSARLSNLFDKATRVEVA